MTETTIDRLTEDEFPWSAIDEMDAVDEAVTCPGCHVIPHPNPEGCTR